MTCKTLPGVLAELDTPQQKKLAAELYDSVKMIHARRLIKPTVNRRPAKYADEVNKAFDKVLAGEKLGEFTVVDEVDNIEVDLETKEIKIPLKGYQKALQDTTDVGKEMRTVIEALIKHELTHYLQAENGDIATKSRLELELEAARNEYKVYQDAGVSYDTAYTNMFDEEYSFTEAELLGEVRVSTDKYGINYHVTNELWDGSIKVNNELGFHVGTAEVVRDYQEQMYKDKPTYVKAVANNKVLTTIEVTDTTATEGGWKVAKLVEELKDKGVFSQRAKIGSFEGIRKALVAQGYDAVVYVNQGEGNKANVNSMVIINPDAVEVADTVYGSEEEVRQLGDRYKGAEAAYWKSVKRNKLNNIKIVEGAVGQLLTVVDTNVNRFEQETIKKVVVGKEGLTIITKRGNSYEVDPATGFVKYSSKRVDMSLFRGIVYGSEKGKGGPDWDSFDRIEKNIHGNVAAMQELIDELADLDNGSDVHERQYFKNLIGMINQEWYGKFTTYLNTNANRAKGFVQGNKLGIYATKNKNATEGSKSNAEVYAHEVVHTVSVAALNSEDVEARRVTRQIRYIMKHAVSVLHKHSFVDKEASNQELEKIESEKLYDYMFNSDNSLEEFTAISLTNPKVIKVLQKLQMKEQSGSSNVFRKLLELFGNLLDVLRGNFKFGEANKNSHEKMLDLFSELAEVNARTINKAREIRAGKRGLTPMELFNELDEKAGNALENLLAKFSNYDGTVPPPPKGKAAYALWATKTIGKMLTHPEYRKSFKLILSSWGLKPEGDIQGILSDFTEGDKLSKAVDWLALAADKIDQLKSSMSAITKKAILEEFSTKLTKIQEESLTKVIIDADMQAVFDKYPRADWVKWLTDEDALKTKIGRVKAKLKKADEKNYAWHTNQATGLGYYLATHKAGLAQNFNAANIAGGVMSSQIRKADPEVVALVDEVATLVALQYTGKREKLHVSELMKNEWEGVKNVVSRQKMFHNESKKGLFGDKAVHMVKGYSKEVFDDKVTIEVAPMEQRADLERRGFTLKKELVSRTDNKYGKPMGLFVSEMFETGNWYRAATRLTRMGTKGTSMREAYRDMEYGTRKYRIDKLKIDIDRIKQIKAMEKGELDVGNMEYGLSPLLDGTGAVVDYRYMMDKEAKKSLLGQDTTLSEVMGASIASLTDKMETEQHNVEVLKLIMADMKENYTGGLLGKNNAEYVLIHPDSTDPKIKELYELMPKSFKQAAANETSKGLAVRRDLLHTYFGFRHASILDFPGLDKITPKMVHGFIKVAEALWEEFIKIVKVAILIKIPAVIVFNIVSNIMYAISTGSSLTGLIEMYKESIRDSRLYITEHRELIALELRRRSGEKGLDGRIATLQKSLKKNPVSELAELGMYQAIVEDISNTELTSSNRLKQMITDKTNNVPNFIKKGAQWMYLTEETSYYKFMAEVLQISDLVARDVENRKLKKLEEDQANGRRVLPRWWIEHVNQKNRVRNGSSKIKLVKKALTGAERKEFFEMAKEKRHTIILRAFINYNKPPGKVENYLNRMGAVMFTTFAKRIQYVIATTGVKHPIKSLMVLLGQHFLLDVETIQDQAILTRSWYTVGLSSNDFIPFTNPLDRIMSVVTPPLIRPATYQF